MGSMGWTYFVPYQPDVAKALRDLQRQVQSSGEFIGSEGPSDAPVDFLAVCEKNMAQGTSGTHSILDIVAGISESPEMMCASPVDEQTLFSLYGTTKPTHEQVEAKNTELNEPIERWEARYLVVYRDGKPDELYFSGNTGD